MDVRTARIEALRANINRYSQLLTTQLTGGEREFIHTRFAEGRMALDGLYAALPFQMSPSGPQMPVRYE